MRPASYCYGRHLSICKKFCQLDFQGVHYTQYHANVPIMRENPRSRSEAAESPRKKRRFAGFGFVSAGSSEVFSKDEVRDGSRLFPEPFQGSSWTQAIS